MAQDVLKINCDQLPTPTTSICGCLQAIISFVFLGKKGAEQVCLLFLENFHLTGTGTQRTPIHWFAPQLPSMARAEAGGQELNAGFPHCVAGTQ